MSFTFNFQYFSGLLYAVSLFIAILVVISMQRLEQIGRIVCAVAKSAWAVIETIIDFVWSLLVKVLKSPVPWGVLTLAGAGLSMGNVLVGAVVMTAGVLGISCTLYYGTTKKHLH